ncbi:hypothetical protein ABIF70_005116 [Bradyrhizobium japonicum]
MGHAPLKFWKAWEDRYVESTIGHTESRRTLIVTGMAKVGDGVVPTLQEVDERRKLESEISRGGEPKTLHLMFNMLQLGNSNSWKTVWFQQEIETDKYKEVHLEIPSAPEERVDVIKLTVHHLPDKGRAGI